MRIRKHLLGLTLFLILFAGMVRAEEKMPYRIEVDCFNNITTVFRTSDDVIVRQMTSSTGTVRWKTIQGTYLMPKMVKTEERTEWYQFEDGIGKYGSRINGNFLFHSYLFHSRDNSDVDWDTYAGMGTGASHGCVRLYVEDAKWIAENCLAGTSVHLYTPAKPLNYLKELLFENTYSIDSGIPYEEFAHMASSEEELGYLSQGDAVASFQKKLISLGLYGGDADGLYDGTMVNAVLALQKHLGLEPTGVADSALIQLLDRPDAPFSTISTLEKGASGPAVRYLKGLLVKLGYLSGEADDSFDDDMQDAVNAFQISHGLEPSPAASPALQSAARKELDELGARFGEGGWKVTLRQEIRESAKVNTQSTLNLRREPSAQSEILTVLMPGAELNVLDHGAEWTQVSDGRYTGYLANRYLIFEERFLLLPDYEAANAPQPSDRQMDQPLPTREIIRGHVNTDSRLILRAEPKDGADVVIYLSPGVDVQVLHVEDGWANIDYCGKTGYTMERYLDITECAELADPE